MNTIDTIVEQINAKSKNLTIVKEQVEVTSYRQEGDHVRVFYKLDVGYGKSLEELKRIPQPIRDCSRLIPDPFKEGGEVVPPEPEDIPPAELKATIPASAFVGENVNVAVAILPEDTTDKTYTVTASPTGIVEILNGGAILKTLKPGNVVLTIASNVKTDVKTTHQLEVKAVVVEPTSITATVPQTTRRPGDKVTPTVTFAPTTTTDKGYTLRTTTPDIVTINGKELTLIKDGEAKVFATSVAKPSVESAELTIVVSKSLATSMTMEIESTDFTGTNAKVGDTFKLKTKVTPTTADQEVDFVFTPTTAVEKDEADQYIILEAGSVTIKGTSKTVSVNKTITLTVAEEVTEP